MLQSQLYKLKMNKISQIFSTLFFIGYIKWFPGTFGSFASLILIIFLYKTLNSFVFIVLFIYGWNQYLWPLLVTTEEDYYTIVMGVHRMLNTGESLPVWDQIMGTATLALLPPVLIILLMQKLFVKGLIETEK